MKKKTAFYFITIMIVLLALEVSLRLSGTLKTSSEKTSRQFLTYYSKGSTTWYLTWPPNQPIVYDQPEYKCSYPANSLGLREKEIPKERKDSFQRLFIIGDSFVEGDGVAYPFSMPRGMEKKLDSAQLHFEVYNAGVCSSDPFYEYTLLRDKLLQYKPTHVILCINNSDITDYFFRGGMERFQANGTTQYRNGPWWKHLYQYSHIVRLIARTAGYDETLMTEKELKEQTPTAIDSIYYCLENFKLLCDQNHIKCIIAIHPFPDTFSRPDVIDHRIRCRRTTTRPVNMIDLFYAFSEHLDPNNYLQYGWKIDRHFNAAGYQLFADLLFNEINTQYPDFWNKPK